MEGRHPPPKQYTSYPNKPDLSSLTGRQLIGLAKTFTVFTGCLLILYKSVKFFSDRDPGPLRKLFGTDTNHMREVIDRQNTLRAGGIETYNLLSPHLRTWIHEDKVRMHQSNSFD